MYVHTYIHTYIHTYRVKNLSNHYSRKQRDQSDNERPIIKKELFGLIKESLKI